jgi:hypothetical protein
MLRVVIKGAKTIGWVDLLINDQTVPRIMGKMPLADWKEWTMRRDETRMGTRKFGDCL